MKISGGYFFQISPNLMRRKERTQFKNESKTKENKLETILIIHNTLIIHNIQEIKNAKVRCKDLISWVARKQKFDERNCIL